MVFRPLVEAELEAAHAIIADVTAWLAARGIVQWPTLMPMERYRERQARGENFGLFEPGLTAVMTLAPAEPEYWQGRATVAPFWWLSTLAASREHPGAGRRALTAAEDAARAYGVNAIYLDCVDRDDALPSFYRGAGYTQLDRKEVWYGWPMCLFEKRLARAD